MHPFPSSAHRGDEQLVGGMARTKNPNRGVSKSKKPTSGALRKKEPMSYTSRQVQVGGGQTSAAAEAVPERVNGNSKSPGKKCSPATIISIVENGISDAGSCPCEQGCWF
ncbi:unnamed protein product [Linum trigynum]|uniref:Uncharacterized protein n=1 Tax=Linum trigynum TaxID=586398 RepID=A0AAV2GBV8_9ROSI